MQNQYNQYFDEVLATQVATVLNLAYPGQVNPLPFLRQCMPEYKFTFVRSTRGDETAWVHEEVREARAVFNVTDPELHDAAADGGAYVRVTAAL